MNMTKGPARLGFVVALLALLIAPLAFGGHSAQAQGPTQNTYYGSGLDDGVMVGASIDDVLCGETENSASGGWVIRIDEGDCDGGAVGGATITFSLDGAAAEQTATWSPANSADLSLTVAAMPQPTAEPTAMVEPTDGDGMTDGDGDGMTDGDGDGMTDGDGDGMTDGDGDGMTDGDGPGMVDTGNAGLVSSASSSSLLALALGFLAVAGIAGARVATRRVS